MKISTHMGLHMRLRVYAHLSALFRRQLVEFSLEIFEVVV